MITADIKGDREVIARFAGMPARVHAALLAKVTELDYALVAKVKGKLSGEVLNVVTGNLRRSIFGAVDDGGANIYGRVASSGDVKYAAIQEYGGKTGAHDIVPTKAQALAFMVGGKQVFARIVHHPGSNIPSRSYMRSSLADMKAEIIAGLSQAVAGGVRAS